MNELLQQLYSGAYNELFSGGAYAELMTASAHVIGWLGLILTFWATYVGMSKRKEMEGPLMLGLCLRVLFCIYNTYLTTFNVDGFEDWAADLSNDSYSQIFASYGDVNIYTLFCGLLYKVGGRNPMLLQDLNIVFWAISMRCIPRIADLLAAPRAARPAAWLYAVMPSTVFFSTVILRESLCTVGVVFGCYHLLRANRYSQVRDYLLAGVWFAIASLVHYGCVSLLVALAVAAISGRGQQARGGRRLWFTVGSIVFAAGLVLALFQFGLIDQIAPRFSKEELSIEAVGGGLNTLIDRGRTDYMSGLETTTGLGLLWTTPIRFVYFLITPFPWQIRKLIDLAAFLDAVTYVVALWWLWRARKAIRDDAAMRNLILCCLAALFVFAMGTYNFGTAVRHREKFFLVVMTLACAAREIQRVKQRAPGFGPGLPLPPRPVAGFAGAIRRH